MYEEKERGPRHPLSVAVAASVVLGRRSLVAGRQSPVVDRRSSVVDRRSLVPKPKPKPSHSRVESYHRPAVSPPPNVVAPPRQNPTSRRSRDPRSSPSRTSEGNPSSLSPERLRLSRCPGNLSLGLATTASVCRGSIHCVPSPRSFSSAAFSALFFPPLFLILVFLLL